MHGWRKNLQQQRVSRFHTMPGDTSSTRGIVAQATSTKESPSTKTSDKVTHKTNGLKCESADLFESRSMVRIVNFEEYLLESTFACSTSVPKTCNWEVLNARRLREKNTISTNSFPFFTQVPLKAPRICSRPL